MDGKQHAEWHADMRQWPGNNNMDTQLDVTGCCPRCTHVSVR